MSEERPFESELPPLPQSPSFLSDLRSLMSKLPAPLPASAAGKRSGQEGPEPPDATTEMAQPLTPQPESFITTNPTTTKTNMLADPAFETLSAWNGTTDLTEDGAWHDLTTYWQYAVVLNSGTLTNTYFRLGESKSREDADNPYNSALLGVTVGLTVAEQFDVDLYLAPKAPFSPTAADPTQDFLNAQAVAVKRLNPDSDITVQSVSLQLVKNPGVSEVVLDESPLFDVKGASVGDQQYLLSVISETGWAGNDYQWRLRCHFESAGTGTVIGQTNLEVGEPLLSFSSSPDPVTYAPYIGRWTPAFLQNNFVRFDQIDSYSTKGVDAYSIPDNGDAFLRFRLRDDAGTGWYPRLAIGVDSSGVGSIYFGPGPTSGPDTLISRVSAGYLRIGNVQYGGASDIPISLDLHADQTSDNVTLLFSLASEANARMAARLNAGVAEILFGAGGASALDRRLYRSGSGQLTFDDGAGGDGGSIRNYGEMYLYRASGAGNVLLADPTNGATTNMAFIIKNDGTMLWGPGSPTARDITMYRSGGAQLYVESTGGSATNNPVFRVLSDATPGASDYTAFAATRAGDSAAVWIGGYMGDKQATGIGLGGGSTRDVFLYRSSDSRLRIQTASVDSFGSGDYAAFRWLDSSENAKWLIDYGTGTSNDLRVMYATGTTPSESAVEVMRYTYNDGSGPRILLGRQNSRIGFDGYISPTALAADTHNWAPTNYDLVNHIRISTDATPRTITGIVAPPNAGIFYWLFNVNSSVSVTLAHDNASSTAANRFYCPNNANVVIRPRGGVMVVYDVSSSRWRVVAP